MLMLPMAPGAAPLTLQQVEDLRLDGDVECGGRLVGQQQVGLAGKRHRDHRPLPHPARQTMRIIRRPGAGRRDAHLVEQVDRAVQRLAPAGSAVQHHRLGDLPTDRHRRVERGRRLLEHHRRCGRRAVPAMPHRAGRAARVPGSGPSRRRAPAAAPGPSRRARSSTCRSRSRRRRRGCGRRRGCSRCRRRPRATGPRPERLR